MRLALRARRITRRGLAAAGAVVGATIVGGCGGALANALGEGSRLSLFLLGFPADVTERLSQGLQRCAELYGQGAGAPRPRLAVRSLVIPPSAWFSAVSDNPNVRGPAVPATTMVGTPAQIMAPGGPLIINGRTPLDVKFGADPLPVPKLRNGTRDWPDLVLAYDAWQYWLSIMATPQLHLWQQSGAWNAGISEPVALHGRWWTGTDTVFAAWPLLRSPMGLWASRSDWRPSTPWTWSSLVAEVGKQGSRDNTTGFAVSLAIPAQTEAAMAVVYSAGGALGVGASAADPRSPLAAVRTAETGWSALAGARQSRYANGLQTALWPGRIWSAFWGSGGWGPPSASGARLWPFPAGAARRAAPGAYLCAIVPLGASRPALAASFASFLWSRPAQSVLGGLQAGLELRPADALVRIARTYPFVQQAERFVDPSDDLTLQDLFGAWKTASTTATIDAAVDAFANRLAGLQSSGA